MRQGLVKDEKGSLASHATKVDLRARGLSEELGKEMGGPGRRGGEVTAYVKMSNGGVPEVLLTGYWDGKMVKIAQNAVAKAYRARRYKKIRPGAGGKKGEGDEEA